MTNENMQAEFVDEAVETEVTTPEALDAFDDGWDSDGIPSSLEDVDSEADEANSEEAEADQQEAESADASTTEEAPAAQEEAESKPADQRLTLKHYTGNREATLDEAVVLAQKGIDYDIKVPKLNAKIAEYEDFLKEIAAPNNYSIEQLMNPVKRTSASGMRNHLAYATFLIQNPSPIISECRKSFKKSIAFIE